MAVDSQKVLIRRGRLVYRGKVLGPADKVYAYTGEDKHLGGGAIVCRTPENIDLLFAVGGRVVGCEVKTVADLVNSHRSRRLHRQLQTLADTVDISCLVIRGAGECPFCLDALPQIHPHPHIFWGDVVNWQTCGVYILPVPAENYIDRLLVYQKALASSGRRALMGTDQRPPRERKPGWLLRRIPGIGPGKSAKLMAEFGSVDAVFQAAKLGHLKTVVGKSVEDKVLTAIKG